MIFGVGDERDKYNGSHNNITFYKFQTFRDIVWNHIIPKPVLEFIEFYISGNDKNILIELEKKKEYDRNILIKIHYNIGTIYEIYYPVGNIDLKAYSYQIGTSFTRDGSHARPLTQIDRKRIESIVYSSKDLIQESIFKKIPQQPQKVIRDIVQLFNPYRLEFVLGRDDAEFLDVEDNDMLEIKINTIFKGENQIDVDNVYFNKRVRNVKINKGVVRIP